MCTPTFSLPSQEKMEETDDCYDPRAKSVFQSEAFKQLYEEEMKRSRISDEDLEKAVNGSRYGPPEEISTSRPSKMNGRSVREFRQMMAEDLKFRPAPKPGPAIEMKPKLEVKTEADAERLQLLEMAEKYLTSVGRKTRSEWPEVIEKLDEFFQRKITYLAIKYLESVYKCTCDIGSSAEEITKTAQELIESVLNRFYGIDKPIDEKKFVPQDYKDVVGVTPRQSIITGDKEAINLGFEIKKHEFLPTGTYYLDFNLKTGNCKVSGLKRGKDFLDLNPGLPS